MHSTFEGRKRRATKPVGRQRRSSGGGNVQPPTADWGSMVRENAKWITYVPYFPFPDAMYYALKPLLPAGCIALLTIAVNFIVDWFLHETSGLRDV